MFVCAGVILLFVVVVAVVAGGGVAIDVVFVCLFCFLFYNCYKKANFPPPWR